MTNPTPGLTTIAVEIDSPFTWAFLCTFDPQFNYLSYDENVGRFVLLNAQEGRWSIWTPEMIGEKFDHIEPSDAKIKFVNIIHKKD